MQLLLMSEHRARAGELSCGFCQPAWVSNLELIAQCEPQTEITGWLEAVGGRIFIFPRKNIKT